VCVCVYIYGWMWDTGNVQIQRRRLRHILSAPVQSPLFQVELLLSPLAKLLQKELVGLVESVRLHITVNANAKFRENWKDLAPMLHWKVFLESVRQTECWLQSENITFHSNTCVNLYLADI